MDPSEVLKLVSAEDRHWWYAERRALLRRQLQVREPGVALDVGAAGGGNTRVLQEMGWRAIALEYGDDGAAVARARGLDVVRADARRLPVADGSVDLVVALDVLEHIDDDAAVVREVRRVLRPGGVLLVAVPADMRLWSAHDEALGHVRRYTRDGLLGLVESSGLHVDRVTAWNVLLRPVVRLRRAKMRSSDTEVPHPLVNAGLRAAVAVERWVPLGRRLPGVSLRLEAHK